MVDLGVEFHYFSDENLNEGDTHLAVNGILGVEYFFIRNVSVRAELIQNFSGGSPLSEPIFWINPSKSIVRFGFNYFW